MMREHDVRKVLVSALAATLILSCAGAMALAEDGVSIAAEEETAVAQGVGSTFQANVTVGDAVVPCTFKVTSDDTVQMGNGDLSAIDTSIGGALVIPNTVSDGTSSYTVTALGARCLYGSSITDTGLASNKTVTSLGDGCFSDCDSLVETGLGANTTLTSLGDGCFRDCDGLADTDLSSNTTLTSLGAHCFEDCDALTNTGLAANAALTSLSQGCFENCGILADTGLAANASIRSLGDYCFQDCDTLKNTGLAGNAALTSLGDFCFNDCDGLADTGLAGNTALTSLGAYCFNDCSALTSTGLATNKMLTSLSNGCFSCCVSLTNTGLASNASLTSLGQSCFYGCVGLTDTGLATNHVLITPGDCCFEGCVALTDTGLATNTTVTSLGECCFASCDALTDTGLATNVTVTALGERCFACCVALVDAATPSSLTSCGDGVFEGCDTLGSVCLYGDLKVDLTGAPDGLNVYYLAGDSVSPSSAREGDTAIALSSVTVDGGMQSASTNCWCALEGASSGRHPEGEVVTITADSVDGSAFDHWKVTSGDVTLADPTSISTTFVAGKDDVELTAVYIPSASPIPDVDPSLGAGTASDAGVSPASDGTETTPILPETGDGSMPMVALVVSSAVGVGLMLIARRLRS